MAFSQNGYLASKTPSDFGGLNNDYVPGTTVRLAPGVRADEVGDMLRYVAMRFHREVEPLMKVGCWGYAYRAVRAGLALSNHASATAEDLNAPKHPLGARGTFTPAQVAAIRRILASCTDGQGPLIRWGGDYANRADEMHFEAIGSLARIRAHMRFLTQPGAPVRPPITPATPATPAPVEDDDMTPTEFRQEFANILAEAAAPAEGSAGNYGRHVRDHIIDILADTVVARTWSAAWGSGSGRQTAAERLYLASLVADPAALASAIASQLPAGSGSQADVETALRNVLGSLNDNQE